MSAKKTIVQKRERPQQAWAQWAREHTGLLERATEPQRILLEAAVRFVAGPCGHPIVLRLVAFFLLHVGMGLTPAVVGAAVGRTERAMRTVQALSVHELLESMWKELGRHRQPKLHAEHAGPIAKYLVEHPDCTQAEVVAFVERELQITVNVQTLRRFCKAYGLGVLRVEGRTAAAKPGKRPFVLDALITEEPLSCCPSRLR